ncbi:PhoH family protein [bacterium]|nr:PhoH family protein [bacterium]
MEEQRISIKGVDLLQLLGWHDSHLRYLEKYFPAKIVIRHDEIRFSGPPSEVDALKHAFTEMLFLLNRNGKLEQKDVETVVDMIRAGDADVSKELDTQPPIILYTKHSVIRPRTKGQEDYVASVAKNDIVFAIGPAGTGKTYLAVAFALAQLREKNMSRIILTRPAIEAGESLGFLPGDLMEKVDPYLRPLTDALFDMLSADQLQKYVDRKIIEIVPLGYMRGRTLNDAFVILDEAQNASALQMKMFLTRLGNHSKAIVTGDITQVDLPDRVQSGLIQIQNVLQHIEGIGFVYFDKQDVVRHRLVKKIIQAYENFDDTRDEG